MRKKFKMKKAISVIIPCFNHGNYLKEAVDSVLLADKESICQIIVVNDGSTDKFTLEVFEDLKLKGIKVFDQKNSGLAKARNKGLELANEEYVLFLDADNRIRTEFIDEFKILRGNNIDFDMIYGNAIVFGDQEGKIIPGEFNIFRLFNANYIDACSVLKKEFVIKLGGFDEKMPYMGWEDWDLWIRIGLIKANCVYINKNFFEYRFLNNSMIRTNSDKESETRNYLINKHNILLDKDYLNSQLNRLLERKVNSNLRFGIVIKIMIYKMYNKLVPWKKKQVLLNENYF